MALEKEKKWKIGPIICKVRLKDFQSIALLPAQGLYIYIYTCGNSRFTELFISSPFLFHVFNSFLLSFCLFGKGFFFFYQGGYLPLFFQSANICEMEGGEGGGGTR